MTKERYNPVPMKVDDLRRRWMRDPAFAEAYAALEDEFAALGELLHARQHANLTQAQVAERMGVPQSSVARLESSIGSRKHAPSIATLRRYADAVDAELRITLVPKAQRRERKPA
jgi:DNA-binding XRE family transcriptional regulator